MPEGQANIIRDMYNSTAGSYLVETLTKRQPYLVHVFDFLDNYVAPGARVLDVGCGPGNFTVSLDKSVLVVGIDISSEMIGIAAQHRPSGQYVVHDYHDPLPVTAPFDEKFDVIIASSCFEFCKNLDIVLKSLGQALKLGGHMYFTVNEKRPGLAGHAEREMVFDLKKYPQFSTFFWSFAEVSQALEGAGLVPVRYEHAKGWFNRYHDCEMYYGYWHVTRSA